MTSREPASIAPFRLLLRHADAGRRERLGGADEWRALSPSGRAEAEAVVTRFDSLPIVRILSGPALRCRQTVVPLARELGLDVEPCRELAVDATPRKLLRLLQDHTTEGAVLCTHRETLERLFSQLALASVGVPWSGPPMEKAAAWMLCGIVGNGTGVRLRYLSPTDSPDTTRWPEPVVEPAAWRHDFAG